MVGVVEIAVIAELEAVTDSIAAVPNRSCCERCVIQSVTVVTGLYSNGSHSITAVRA